MRSSKTMGLRGRRGLMVTAAGAALVLAAGINAPAWAGDAAPAAPGPADAAATSPAASPAAAAAPAADATTSSTTSTNVGEVVVTASRTDMIGKADTASEGEVTQKEVELRPVYRIGQLFETVPGLVVTVHSGEGKANQYLIRGFNLDHGTDFANFVDDMPVNRPTNTHGQGYSDLNFLMPQVVAGIDYTKGPYFAAIGDFGSVASSHVKLANDIPDYVSASLGTLHDQDVSAGGTIHFNDNNRLLGAFDTGHLGGPWDPPQDFNKFNATLRFSHGDAGDGFSLTGMVYKSDGLLTTDQPLRALQEGLISRYGTLDPTDASASERYSLSAHYEKPIGQGGQFTLSLYGIHSTMTLWNDFTHFLDDPVNGDQEAQDETRNVYGGVATYTQKATIAGIESDTTIGLDARYDVAFVDRKHTLHKTTLLNYCEQESDSGTFSYPAVNGDCNADKVHLLDLGPYIENTTHWTDWARTVVGLREEYYQASDTSLVTGGHGSGSQTLFQPKGSLIFGPFHQTELYLSAGEGFHSDDVRGVFGTVPQEGIPPAGGPTPLHAKTTGEEIGLRSNLIPKVRLQASVFQQDFNSELEYNADSGQDEAGPPSRRQGVELSAEYKPAPWIEFNSDLAFSKARYRAADLSNYGLDGPYIANAPSFIGSFGIILDNLGPWSGGLQWRYLGKYPINDGDRDPEDPGYSEVNLDVGYKIGDRWKIEGSIYNLFNSHANSSAYEYVSRLPGEPADGVNGIQFHPLEPRSARLEVTRYF